MSLLSLAFNWVLNWLIGWGGLSLIVAAIAGVVWWFVPPVLIKVRSLAFSVAVCALAFNFVFTMGYELGTSTTTAAWEKKGLENEIATMKVDAQMQRDTAALAKQTEEALTAKTATLEQQVQEFSTYAQSIPSTASVSRHATADDVRRLCDIGGPVDRGPDCPANPKRLRSPR